MKTCKNCSDKEICGEYYLGLLNPSVSGILLCEARPGDQKKYITKRSESDSKKIKRYIQQDEVKHNPQRIIYVSPLSQTQDTDEWPHNAPLDQSAFDSKLNWKEMLSNNISIYDFTFIQDLEEEKRDCLLLYISNYGTYENLSEKIHTVNSTSLWKTWEGINEIRMMMGIRLVKTTYNMLFALYYKLEGRSEEWIGKMLKVTQEAVHLYINNWVKIKIGIFYNP
jgi:hypothetical protein